MRVCCDLMAQQWEPSSLPPRNMSYKWNVRRDRQGRSKRLDSNEGLITICGLPRLLTVLGCADAAQVNPGIVESYAPH